MDCQRIEKNQIYLSGPHNLHLAIFFGDQLELLYMGLVGHEFIQVVNPKFNSTWFLVFCRIVPVRIITGY